VLHASRIGCRTRMVSAVQCPDEAFLDYTCCKFGERFSIRHWCHCPAVALLQIQLAALDC
jgi:hypothetical protein